MSAGKSFARSLGYALGTCLKYYLYFMIPTIWFWFPILIISGYYSKREE